MQMDLKKEEQQMNKVWLESYPPGVPAEINPDAYQSIVDALDQTFSQYAENKAFHNMDSSFSCKIML